MARRRRNRVAAQVEECYMCASPGITAEHVPPKSFFEPRDRQGLVTIPSCRKHNLDYSDDVEEIRNGITMAEGINVYGTRIGTTKTLASFLRKRKLFWKMFRGAREANVDGREVILHRIDMTKFKRVMKAIGHALYCHDNGVRFGFDWHVYGTGMLAQADLLGDLHNAHAGACLAN